MSVNMSKTEFEKRQAIQKDALRRKNRRRGDLEAMLTGQEIVKAKVTGQEISLFLDSHTVMRFGLRASDTGVLDASWRSLDTIKTDEDSKQ